jgi:ribosomal protein L40E
MFDVDRYDLGETTVMGIRPRTDHVMKLKSRRCPKCGGAINSQKTRCKRCHATQTRPKKTKNS